MNDGIPHFPGESAGAFLAGGYLFGSRRFEKHHSDAFACKLLGRPTIVLRGQDAARFFYEEPAFTRVGAMPTSVVHSLQDERSVQTLSGDAHRTRKDMFLDAFGYDGRLGLARMFSQHWERAQDEWSAHDIVLLDAVSTVLTRTALEWAGIPLDAKQTETRAREFQAMIDGAGSFGARNWRGRMLRRRTEQWAREVVDQRRSDSGGTAPVDLIAGWIDESGRRLDPDVAAVELLNMLRPIVAVARFIVFAAVALHRNPEWRARVLSGPHARTAFAAEVRRTTPFFPVAAARPMTDLTFNGIELNPHHRVMLDLFATNRHPREWADADRFDPSRFMTGGEDPRRIVAQGAGDMAEGHRCPGEPTTATLLEVAVTNLAGADWSLTEGVPFVDLRRVPANPGARPLRIHWKSA